MAKIYIGADDIVIAYGRTDPYIGPAEYYVVLSENKVIKIIDISRYTVRKEITLLFSLEKHFFPVPHSFISYEKEHEKFIGRKKVPDFLEGNKGFTQKFPSVNILFVSCV